MEITTENYFFLKEQGKKRSAIASEFSLTEDQLKRLITKNGWAKKPPIIGNKNAFSSLNENSCYWGGFLAADGNIDSRNRVRIMLNYDDTSHLEKFRDFIKSTHKISSNTDKYYRSSFECTSSDLCRDLASNFCIVPNKTAILRFPSIEDTNLLRHYIRGYFDGDGSVCESFSNRNSTTATIYATFASGSKSFANDLFETLEYLIGLRGSIQEFENKCQLKYNTNDAKVLLSWMYESSSVYLDRKYKKYVDIVVNNNRLIR